LALRQCADSRGIKINELIDVTVSSRKGVHQRRIDELLQSLNAGDTVIVAELSRLGRSINELLQIVDALIKAKVRLVSVKESININGKMDIQSKTMVTVFSLLAEIERDLISMRTKEGLARANGVRLGRPKGPGKSKLDGMEDEIRNLMGLGVTKSSMTKIFGVSWCALDNFIKTRKLKPAKKPVTRLKQEQSPSRVR
jgi:DNA invertase Pin-like site-specific DNA recombinase